MNKDYYMRQLHQIFPLYTWIIDLVYFGTDDNGDDKPKGKSYLLCVEANSRYAVIYPIRIKPKADMVANRLQELITKYRVDKIIGDGDNAFKGAVLDLCNYFNIETDFRKSDDTSHTYTAILDRICRTFRDMLYNLKVDNPSALDMNNLADIYNKTRHGTISEVLNQPTTPEGMHRNESMQLLFIRRLRGINWSKMQKKSYQLPEGRKVFVRNEYNPFDKKRGIVENEHYYVVSHKGALYTVKNKQGDEKVVPRRRLRVCNVDILKKSINHYLH